MFGLPPLPPPPPPHILTTCWSTYIQSNLKQGKVHKLYQLVQSPVRKYIVNIGPLYHTLV